jgi:hypothetical protein
LNYTYRMHDPRVGRFFAVDPLTKKYPYYSPYTFSGNRVIDAIELEGAEPGVIIGSDRQVRLVNEFNTNVQKENQNWSAYKLSDLKTAKIDIQKHKALGNKIKVLMLQFHASYGKMYILPGADGSVDTNAVPLGTITLSDDKSIDVFQITNYYIPELNLINNIKSKREREAALFEFKQNAKTKEIDDFLALVNEIETGGTLILNGCHIFGENEGKDLSDAILSLTNKKINVVGSQDYCSDIVSGSGGKEIFGGNLIPKIYENKGYLKNSLNTNSNLQLNGVGEELFQLNPIDETEEDEKK